jgi:hypothetical protein
MIGILSILPEHERLRPGGNPARRQVFERHRDARPETGDQIAHPLKPSGAGSSAPDGPWAEAGCAIAPEARRSDRPLRPARSASSTPGSDMSLLIRALVAASASVIRGWRSDER